MNRKGASLVIGGHGFDPSAFGAPFQYRWGYRAPPGAGANSWAAEFEALPVYTPGGWGSPNQRQSMRMTQPGVGYAYQGAVLYQVGDPGSVAGQIALQPLTDADAAARLGFATPAFSPQGNQYMLGGTP